jgi:hypothetical protein
VQEFAHSPVEVLGALAAIAGAVSPAFKAGRRFWLNLWALLRSKPMIPRETLRIVQDVNASYWGDANYAGTPAMQVVFDGHVTDISGRQNRILRADIPRPLTHAEMVLVSNHHDARRPQVLSPHECAEIRVCFFVKPVVAEKGTAWQSPILFIDQYGNPHKIKNCLFNALPTAGPQQPREPEEYAYQISDPLEKEVVSVLKAELNRYSLCGRICGGLGSIHIVYQGRQFTGVGGDS